MSEIRPKTCHRRPGTGSNIRSQKINVCSFGDVNGQATIDLYHESNPMMVLNRDMQKNTVLPHQNRNRLLGDGYYPSEELLQDRKAAVLDLLRENLPNISMCTIFTPEFEKFYTSIRILLFASLQERRDFIDIQNMNKTEDSFTSDTFTTDSEITNTNVFEQDLEFIVCAFLNNGYDRCSIEESKYNNRKLMSIVLKMLAYGFMVIHKELPGFFFAHDKSVYKSKNVYSPSYLTSCIEDKTGGQEENMKELVNEMAKNSYTFLDFVTQSLSLLNQILYYREGYKRLVSELPIISYILSCSIDLMRSSYLLYFRNNEIFGNDYASLIYNTGSNLAKSIFNMICLIVKHTFIVSSEWNQKLVKSMYENLVENDVISKVLVFINEFLAYIPIKIDFYDGGIDEDVDAGYVDENNVPIDPSALFDSLPIFLPDELVLQMVESLALMSSTEILYDMSDSLFSYTVKFDPEIYGLEFGDGTVKRKVRNAIIMCFRNLYENVVDPTIHNQVDLNTNSLKNKQMDHLKERLCILEEIVQYLETKMI